MTDQLEADVERWLAEEVRTTWPGVFGDACDTEERPVLAEWFAGQMRAFGAWCGGSAWATGIVDVIPFDALHQMLADRLGPGFRVTVTTADDIDEDRERDQIVAARLDALAAVCPVTASEPPNSTPTPQETNRGAQSDVVGTLLEAAASARTSTTYEAPSNWPPPKPGTHESDLRYGWEDAEEHMISREEFDIGPGGWDEYAAAKAWSTANRKENT